MAPTTPIKFAHRSMTVNGKRCAVMYRIGGYVPTSRHAESTITIYPARRATGFPAGTQDYFAIENLSDSREDYFDAGRIRVAADHPLYAQVFEAMSRDNP